MVCTTISCVGGGGYLKSAYKRPNYYCKNHLKQINLEPLTIFYEAYALKKTGFLGLRNLHFSESHQKIYSL